MQRDEIEQYRRLHRDGAVPGGGKEEASAHADVVSRVFGTLLAAQNGGTVRDQRHRPREGIRARRALQVQLEWGDECHRALTLDVGTGGFATLLATGPPADAAVRVRLSLSRSRAISFAARVADVRQRRGALRVSFAFTELPAEARDQLDRFLMDDALADLWLEAAGA